MYRLIAGRAGASRSAALRSISWSWDADIPSARLQADGSAASAISSSTSSARTGASAGKLNASRRSGRTVAPGPLGLRRWQQHDHERKAYLHRRAPYLYKDAHHRRRRTRRRGGLARGRGHAALARLHRAAHGRRPGLVIEGRNYPESSGPGAGCPPEHGISAADGINCRSAEGVLGDADRDHIDTMVLYPEPRALRADARGPGFRCGLRPALQPVDRGLLHVIGRPPARHRGDADRARRRGDRHHARGEGAGSGGDP